MDAIQRYIDQFEREVHDADVWISTLETRAVGEKVGSKLHTYHEISMIRRRREEAARKLNDLRAVGAGGPEVAA